MNPNSVKNEKESRAFRARYSIAMAMKNRMGTTSVPNITVRQICEEGGISRQTFYRYFPDKYAIINWYFDQLLEESFNRMGQGRTVYDGLCRKFEFIREERLFFTAAFQYDSQNNLREHDFEKIYAFYVNLIRTQYLALDLTGSVVRVPSVEDPENEKRFISIDGQHISEDVLALLEMYCQASVYMTVRWVLSGMSRSPESLAKLMIAALPGRLKAVFQKLHILEQ